MMYGGGGARLYNAEDRLFATFPGWLREFSEQYFVEIIPLVLGLLLLVLGGLLVWAAFARASENKMARANGEKPSRRNASPGCLLAVGVPLLVLGVVIVGWLIWVAVSVSAPLPLRGGMPA